MKPQYAARPDKYLRSCFAVEYTRQTGLAPVFQIEFFPQNFVLNQSQNQFAEW